MGIVHRWNVLVVAVCLAACAVGGSAPAVDHTKQGDETFENVCARCHGKDGATGIPVTPNGPKPRDLTDPAWQATVTDAQLEVTITNGKPPLMPPFTGVLTPEQVRAVVGKVRRLRKGQK